MPYSNSMFQSTPPRVKRLMKCDRCGAYQSVSIHAPAREATLSAIHRCPWLSFQSTPPRGKRRDAAAKQPRQPVPVSIHAPAREVTSNSPVINAIAPRFQSTPPRGKRPAVWLQPASAPECFNPRPRAGSDPDQRPLPRRGVEVSIHAPAREATLPLGECPRDIEVSIHAPAREATSSTSASCSARSRFNPRPRAGSDSPRIGSVSPASVFQSTPPRGKRRRSAVFRPDQWSVSIHAPAREATVPS